MTDNRKLAEYKEHQACEVPLTELLRDIPKDFRVVLPCQWSDDGRETGYRFIPVGYLMHRAANELDAAGSERDEELEELAKDADHAHEFMEAHNLHDAGMKIMGRRLRALKDEA